jgi:cyanamide hydratase
MALLHKRDSQLTQMTLQGQAIAMQHFPEWRYSPETYLLAALLHDIGTTDTNMSSTQLSFEFQGGFQALNLLIQNGAPQSTAESVCETIIRHQDVGETGNITTLTAVIHFATLLDNAGANPELVHKDTIENIVHAWPREGWTGCFASTVRKECQLKPWSHTTKIDGFAEMVEANDTMRPYD